jgi:predicted transcriptional regulator
MEDLLTQIGLTPLQAEAYLYLIRHGDSTPPALAKAAGMTRTNAYKVLESLEEMGLASKHDIQKKYVYRATDPSSLAALVAEKRNRVLALEQNIKTAMRELRSSYRKHSGETVIDHHSGEAAMLQAYRAQAENGEPVYFIKSRADIPFLGFEAMDTMRTLPAKHGVQRYGMTPDGEEGSANPAIDKRANLTRTWIPHEAYTAPVEWSVTGDTLYIHVFDQDGSVIEVRNSLVTDSFRQLWSLLDASVRQTPDYDNLPRRASRGV